MGSQFHTQLFRAPGTSQMGGWVCPRAGLDKALNGKILDPVRNQTVI